jgi:hypothetical protein
MKFRPRILVGVSIFLSIYIGALYAFAVNVAPGTVLDPAGLPGAYTVGPLLSYGEAVTTSHENEILYIDGTGDLASDSLFTRTSTGETILSQTQSSGVDTAAFELNTDVLGLGLDGVIMSRGDTAGVVGKTIFGIIDISSFGASPYAIIGQTQDLVTGEVSNLNIQPNTVNFGVDDASTQESQLAFNSDSYVLRTGNQNYGGNDLIDVTADLNGGAGSQYWYAQYKDSTPVRNSIRLAQEGIRFDYNNFSNTPGTFYVFPQADGSAGQVLTTDGAGTLSFTSAGGGSLTQNYIGFGDAGNALTGSSGFQYVSDNYNFLQTVPDNTGNAGATTSPLSFGAASFAGSGLNDLTLTWNSATYESSKYGGNLTITISSTGATDEFDWSYTGGYSQIIGSGTGVLMMPGVISLTDTNGDLIATVEFAATTGHTLSDQWTAGTSLTTSSWGQELEDSLGNSFVSFYPVQGRYTIGSNSIAGTRLNFSEKMHRALTRGNGKGVGEIRTRLLGECEFGGRAK